MKSGCEHDTDYDWADGDWRRISQSINQSINQPKCLSSRATSRLSSTVVVYSQIDAGSDDKIRMRLSEIKRCFKTLKKIVSDGADVVSSGWVFQIRGPATVKALRPTVESLTGGTS